MQEWKDFSFTCIKDGAPEECIADNFAYAMMNRTDLPNQKLLEDILNLLKNNH